MAYQPPFGYTTPRETKINHERRNFSTIGSGRFPGIGAGAAGGVVAKELSTAGFSVVALEQGPYLRDGDYSHDEIKYTYQPGLTNDPQMQPITYRKNETEPAKLMKAIEYGRQVGGGSVHFTANYWRFHESDFHERSLFGDVPGPSLADWPITYADLEPYYTRQNTTSGFRVWPGRILRGASLEAVSLPPMPVKSAGVLFERGAKKLGTASFPAPVAILSQPYQGRAACAHCGFCEWFGCEMRAKSSTLVSVIPVAEKTGRCEIRPGIRTCARLRPIRVAGRRGPLLRRAAARGIPARKGRGSVRQRGGDGQAAAATRTAARAGELQRPGGEKQ